MVIWYRILQVLITLGIMYGVGAMFTYVYDTNHYTYALLTIIFGSITLTLMIVWVAKIQNNNNMKIKGE